MTTTQAQIMINELRQIKMLLNLTNSEWTDTKGALLILRRKNPRVAKYVRKHFMNNGEYRQEGRNFQYKTSALTVIRAKADREEIIIPK